MCRSTGSAALLSDEVRDRATGAHTRTAWAARMCRRGDETAPYEVGEWILAIDGRQPRDRLTAARDHDLGAPLDALEVLAQPIMKLTDSHLVAVAM
jgi:hypothetical protein